MEPQEPQDLPDPKVRKGHLELPASLVRLVPQGLQDLKVSKDPLELLERLGLLVQLDPLDRLVHRALQE